MKLIISGANGFVATELIRQCMQIPEITTLVLLSRKPIALPRHEGNVEVKQVLVADYESYSQSVIHEFTDAVACVWTVAVTPRGSMGQDPEEVRRICYTCTVAGFKALNSARLSRPFRFIYMSGSTVERDPTKPPRVGWMKTYMRMRGEVENKVLSLARESLSEVNVCVVKPGLITSSVTLTKSVWGMALRLVTPNCVSLEEVSAAILEQAVHGIQQETLENQDLRIIGSRMLRELNTIK